MLLWDRPQKVPWHMDYPHEVMRMIVLVGYLQEVMRVILFENEHQKVIN